MTMHTHGESVFYQYCIQPVILPLCVRRRMANQCENSRMRSTYMLEWRVRSIYSGYTQHLFCLKRNCKLFPFSWHQINNIMGVCTLRRSIESSAIMLFVHSCGAKNDQCHFQRHYCLQQDTVEYGVSIQRMLVHFRHCTQMTTDFPQGTTIDDRQRCIYNSTQELIRSLYPIYIYIYIYQCEV